MNEMGFPAPIEVRSLNGRNVLVLKKAKVFFIEKVKMGISSSTGKEWALRQINVSLNLGTNENGSESKANISLTLSGDTARDAEQLFKIGNNVDFCVEVNINSHFSMPHTEFRVKEYRLVN